MIPRVLAAAVVVTALVTVAACSAEPAGRAPAPDAGPVMEDVSASPIGVPKVSGDGSIADTLPAADRPTKNPDQAGGLAGRAVPTNQWWSSALTGPRTQPIWTHPLAVRAADVGVQISGAPVTASANAVTTPFLPALTVGAATGAVQVAGYGAFHVVLRVGLAGGGSVDATLVQGSPVVWLRFQGATPSLTGAFRDVGSTASRVRLDIAGGRWDVIGDGLGLSGATVTGSGENLAVARVPDGSDRASWERASTADPVVQTTAAMDYDAAAGTVTQTLTARRAGGGAGVWALLPHQQSGLLAGPAAVAGSYPDARGTMSLVSADTVRVRVPMPGLLTAVPQVPLNAAASRAVRDDLGRDLADPGGAGGSYFGLKELGRLATIAEVAAAVGAKAERTAALARLRPLLIDWLTCSGPSDGRYFGYDGTWGGLIAVPAEFGAQDYNDHHFQYGYLVRAASVLASADPLFARDYGDVIDLIVRDYAGSLAIGPASGLPPFRAFNAYLGSSAASGFAPFADGNNQESSSEAVAAWEAVARWGLVRGDKAMTGYGVTHYAMEAATARMYWLGAGLTRPPGYAHTTAGIVWDAKIDYATWFDPKPESVLGIQLLPLTAGSFYRGPSEARQRELGARPSVWGDLFAADLALSDPAAARRRLDAGVSREDSTSRAMVRYWVEALAVLGPPQPGVPAPLGSLAFGSTGNSRVVRPPAG
ncbi:endo-1,3(4)-beta-glucanase [Actinoplanes sp. SE50]|uniref:glycosyl hydrolase n=1 Tax=unclassified Actinoplanes TaxID=2626549 RepID=UPI00023ED45D|nr:MULTISPECIES: glycosyl hydrolase [unclassified Actinoplanes]AEV85001.1 endo-1,3(4)-beta-glucanase [Actinoplanes sp. SE50/110]ATO83392.1 endo-1,3(4)-beta-glucanase [Actinoplanes sp. SE50]SLM00799.1 endo-1,3(4)-beta-glucanase [Actinoplanes sp. SE50/110]